MSPVNASRSTTWSGRTPQSGVRPAEPAIASLNGTFLQGVKARGRVHETLLVMLHGMKSPAMAREASKGIEMFRHGKMSLRGHKAADLAPVRRAFDAMEKPEESQG